MNTEETSNFPEHTVYHSHTFPEKKKKLSRTDYNKTKNVIQERGQ